MKMPIVSVLVLLAAVWPPSMPADAESHRTAVERLFELTDVPQKIAESVDNVLAVQLNQNPALHAHRERVRAFLEEHIGWEALRPAMTAMYMQAFSEQEVGEMNAFYASPTGRKLIERLPALVQERNRIAMQRLQANIGELQEMIQPGGP